MQSENLSYCCAFANDLNMSLEKQEKPANCGTKDANVLTNFLPG